MLSVCEFRRDPSANVSGLLLGDLARTGPGRRCASRRVRHFRRCNHRKPVSDDGLGDGPELLSATRPLAKCASSAARVADSAPRASNLMTTSCHLALSPTLRQSLGLSCHSFRSIDPSLRAFNVARVALPPQRRPTNPSAAAADAPAPNTPHQRLRPIATALGNLLPSSGPRP